MTREETLAIRARIRRWLARNPSTPWKLAPRALGLVEFIGGRIGPWCFGHADEQGELVSWCHVHDEEFPDRAMCTTCCLPPVRPPDVRLDQPHWRRLEAPMPCSWEGSTASMLATHVCETHGAMFDESRACAACLDEDAL